MKEDQSSPVKQKKWVTVLQYFVAYLVAAWTFLQFIDWLLNRYNISPYWVDMLLWIFIGVIPSLVIYLYHKDRIDNKQLTLREKIIFPLNTVLIGVVLYFGFGSSDLGSTTRTITYTTEAGEEKRIDITKEEFRKGFAIFNFQPENLDTPKAWLGMGLSRLLYEDLLQNKNLEPQLMRVDNTSEKVKEAKIFYDSYVDGKYKIIDSVYHIKTFVRNSKDGKVLEEEKFEGKDPLSLVDEISVFIKNYYTSSESNLPSYIDLEVKEYLSPSVSAIESYVKQDYEKAINQDSAFAMAYLQAGTVNLIYNRGKLEERWLVDKAYQYRHKLPLQKQGEALVLKYLAYDEYEKAEELLKLQLKVDPSNKDYNSLLFNVYGHTRNINAYTNLAYSTYLNSQDHNTVFNYINASLIDKNYHDLLKRIDEKQKAVPENRYIFTFKLMPQILMGDLKAAEKTLEKINLIHPDLTNTVKIYEKALPYLKKKKASRELLKKFEGKYRSENTEQIYTLWVEGNQLLQHVTSQDIQVLIMAGENILVSGHPAGRTWEYIFYENEPGNFHLHKMEQNDRENSLIYYNWKINDLIMNAEKLLAEGDYLKAELAYKKAAEKLPEHYFLKDALAHIEYVKNLDSIALRKQFQEIAGTYGPRKFWIEKDKLFYKRTDGSFPRIELLPISGNRYMNLTKYINHFAFEYINGKPEISSIYEYVTAEKKWRKSELKGNNFNRNLEN